MSKVKYKYILFAIAGLLCIAVWLISGRSGTSAAWDQLPYPGLSWGMFPDEVKDILGLENTELTETVIPSDLSGISDKLRLTVDGLPCFAGKADKVVFHFSEDSTAEGSADGENYRLGGVELMFRKDTISWKELVQKIDEEYGKSESRKLWYPEKGASEILREKDLRLLYNEPFIPVEVDLYRYKADSYGEFKRLLKTYYMESIELDGRSVDGESYYIVGIYGYRTAEIEQWLESVK